MNKLVKLFTALCVCLLLVSCRSTSESYTANIKMGRSDSSAHGTKSFALTTVAIEEDTVIAVYLDEYQYLEKGSANAVANSEGMSSNVVDGSVLASKRVNNQLYSANMAKHSSASNDILSGYASIEKYVKGKTIEEIERLICQDTVPEAGDEQIIAGCTLEDVQGYLQAIIDAANEAKKNSSIKYTGEVSNLIIKTADYPAHSSQSFAVTSVLTDGEVIVSSYIDEYQYLDSTTAIPLANYEGMSTNMTKGVVLASKRINNEMYSELMKTHGGSTNSLIDGYKAIENYVNGKTLKELEVSIHNKKAEEVVDEHLVSGCTLVDTLGYIESVIAAMQSTN